MPRACARGSLQRYKLEDIHVSRACRTHGDTKSILRHSRQIDGASLHSRVTRGLPHDDPFQESRTMPLFTSECNCAIRRRIDHRKVIDGVLLGVETFGSRRHSGSLPMVANLGTKILTLSWNCRGSLSERNENPRRSRRPPPPSPELSTECPDDADYFRRPCPRIWGEKAAATSEDIRRISNYFSVSQAVQDENTEVVSWSSTRFARMQSESAHLNTSSHP